MPRDSSCKLCATGTPHDFKHGLTGYVRHKCRCDICYSANSEYKRERYDAKKAKEYYLRNREAARKRWQRYYQENREQIRRTSRDAYWRDLEVARQRGREHAARNPEVKRRAQKKKHAIPVTHDGPWTPAEDAIVLRDDISIFEMCFMLGRSYGSVQGHRSALKTGKIRLAALRPNRQQQFNDLVTALDQLDAPVSFGKKRAARMLREAGYAVAGYGVLQEAIQHRRETRPLTAGDIEDQRRRVKLTVEGRGSRLWTEEEFALISRSDLTIEEMAALTGRSSPSIRTQRHKLRAQGIEVTRRPVTHCRHGHEFTPENTYRTFSDNGNPRRMCKECGRIRNRERARHRRALNTAGQPA